jgi:hypothetical protein
MKRKTRRDNGCRFQGNRHNIKGALESRYAGRLENETEREKRESGRDVQILHLSEVVVLLVGGTFRSYI